MKVFACFVSEKFFVKKKNIEKMGIEIRSDAFLLRKVSGGKKLFLYTKVLSSGALLFSMKFCLFLDSLF